MKRAHLEAQDPLVNSSAAWSCGRQNFKTIFNTKQSTGTTSLEKLSVSVKFECMMLWPSNFPPDHTWSCCDLDLWPFNLKI